MIAFPVVAATAALGIHASQTQPAAPHPTDAAEGGASPVLTNLRHSL
jgi:hypothetical protein